MKKWLLPILAGLFVLSACGQGNAPSSTPTGSDGEGAEEQVVSKEPVEIEFWHAMSGARDEAINEIVEKFNSTSDYITVKAVNQGQGSYADLEKKLMAAARANDLPAVSQVTSTIVPEFVGNNFVEELNPYIEDEEIGLSDESLNDIIEVFREASQWDGTYYTLPFSKSIRILYYNSGLLEEHNLDVPETWDDIRHVAEKVTGDGVVGMGFENDFYLEFESLLTQMGGEYVNEEAREARFASEEGIQALQFIKDLFDDGLARMPGEDDFLSGPFARGDVAMYITSSPGVTHIAPLAEGNIEWSTTVLPTYEGNAATAFFGNEILMYSQSTDEEKEAAWEFMKFLISPEVTTEWAMKSGYLPARYSAIESEEYQQFLEESPEFSPALEQFDIAFMSARIPGTNAVQNILMEEIDSVLLNRKSVEEALTSAQERANEELSNE